MSETGTLSTDERWAIATLRRSMAGVEPDPEALLVGALRRGGQERRRRRRTVSLVAAAAALLLGLGTLGVVAHGTGTRVADPAAPLSSFVPTPPAHLDGRTAALYLTRLTGRTPTDYDGDANDQAVTASLSFDGHKSKLRLGDDGHVTPGPTEIEASDIFVSLEPTTSSTLAEMHRDGIFACAGRWLDGCETSEPAAGRTLTTGSALTANGCCAIRGPRVTVVAYQRTDNVVVRAEGRPDMFSVAELSAIAMSPVWDLRAKPTVADVEDADRLLPY